MYSSCSKFTEEPISTKLTKIQGIPPVNITGKIVYDSLSRITSISPYGSIWSVKLSYNTDGQVTQLYHDDWGGYSKTIFVNYKNGPPCSGKVIYHSPTTTRDNHNPEYTVDSLSYKTVAGLVTEIKYFDRKTYLRANNKLTSIEKDTTAKFILTYSNNNLIKVRKGNAESNYTYGSNNGIYSANRLKFVLYADKDFSPEAYSANELVSSTPLPSTGTKQITYSYQYNRAGFPVSATYNYIYEHPNVSPVTGTINYVYE
jgi:hypothetical protein